MTLKDKKVQIFTDGGWSISGLVIGMTDKMLTIEDDDKTLSIVWKDKISIAKILEQKNKDKSVISDEIEKFNQLDANEVGQSSFPMNDLNYTNTFFGIPKTLLRGSEMKEENDKDDFSISFSESDNKNSGISFRSSDDS